MFSGFDLIINANDLSYRAEFRLLDLHGSQIAYRLADFKALAASRFHGLFDLRNYLRLYIEEGKEAAAVAEIGVCIAEEVLGKDIFEKLWASESQRTLRVQLPGATEEGNRLVAALARVPWEIARPALGQPTLGERNLLVRVVHEMPEPASRPLELASDEPLRVLFVFAEARGSSPLGARDERQKLLRLFEKEIYPQRRVVAHFLTHGVTRDRLESQIRDSGGYHIVHWSGHGYLNLLELARPGGASDPLSGDELRNLFTVAGGFLPRLVFLSACHSGDILRVKDWNDFLAVARGKEPDAKNAATKQLDLQKQPGFTGIAHALLQGGVPSVVAMRYAVGDDYACELAVEFYRALLAHAQPKPVVAALTHARRAMLDGNKHDAARFDACDHATPVLYGMEQPDLTPVAGRSPELNLRTLRLHQITELTSASHEHFVGRLWELAGLGAEFIGSSTGANVKSVSVITGLGGMGKTALVAETLALWEKRFEWVLLYQAKPNSLNFEAAMRDIDLKLRSELGRYHDHVKVHRADAIYRERSEDFTGPARLERLTRNLIRALHDEAILLVLDNFESNVKETAEAVPAAGGAVWTCQDQAWDVCLAALGRELAGSRSRVIITCRHPLAALADGASHTVLLGPLPPLEAALYLRSHPALSRMIFGNDAGEKALALRLLNASRFHPLLMDRLARLAGDVALRAHLLQALNTLENTRDFSQLPALFATTPGDAMELAYLDDALATSIDQLVRDASPDARRLLWMISLANEPVIRGLLKHTFGEADSFFETLPKLPPRPEKIESLLRYLVSVGLITELRSEVDGDNGDFISHELVQERIRAWMKQYPHDLGQWTEASLRIAYAQRLEWAFKSLIHRNMDVGLRFGINALVYYLQAGAWEEIDNFAGYIVSGPRVPRLLQTLIPHLQKAVELAPEGRPRWSCLCHLADVLNRCGEYSASLDYYSKAASLARVGAESESADSKKAWEDLASITANWAGALLMTGDPDNARHRWIEAAHTSRIARQPAIEILGHELGALRIDLEQGQLDVVFPEIEARVAQVQQWWKQHRSGQRVPEAPNSERLARAWLGALDVALHAHNAKNDLESALAIVEMMIETKQMLGRPPEDLALDRFNRANAWAALGHHGVAKTELEDLLPLFQYDAGMRAIVLSSLADLLDQQGDVAQAINLQRRALVIFEQMPNPEDRARSHAKLSSYLVSTGTPPAVREALLHLIAAILYRVAAGLERELQGSAANYVTLFLVAGSTPEGKVVPRVSDLLADPAFHPLEQWLRQRKVNLEEFQAAVDRFLKEAP